MVNLLKGEKKNPLYVDDDQEKEFKTFKGKTPKEVAKKVVTEVCRLLRKENYKQFCIPIKVSDLEKRRKLLWETKDNIENVDMSLYHGFQFELVDTLNKTSDGHRRVYKYYGERIKLENPKKYKGKNFHYESQVIPIRKDYDIVHALLDHEFKSQNAQTRYKKTLNFERSASRVKSSPKKSAKKPKNSIGKLSKTSPKTKTSPSNSKKNSKSSKRSRSPTRSKSSSGGGSRKKAKKNTRSRSLSRTKPMDADTIFRNHLSKMTHLEVISYCNSPNVKMSELNIILDVLRLPKTGAKENKCERIKAYYTGGKKKNVVDISRRT
jgi:hypothetical protein